MLEHLDAIATHWESLVRPGQTLADYGGKANLLECVPTYINRSRLLQCRQCVDDAARRGNRGSPKETQPARRNCAPKANRLLPAVLALYEPGQGVWDALHDDGTRVQVRHVFDFATIGLTIPDDLSPKMRTK